MPKKESILILGKLPPPIIGPAIATQIILHSDLKNRFDLTHLDTRMNADIKTMGKWRISKTIRSITIYWDFIQKVTKNKPKLILVPISQTTMGFIKDSIFILLGSLLDGKVLIQLRGSNFKNWLEGASKFTNSYVRFILKKCAGVIVLGNNLKHLFQKYFEDEEIFVVPNGADYELLNRKEEGIQVLYLSNFVSTKGFDTILEAISILKSNGVDNFKLKASGAWYEESFKKRCLGIIDRNDLEHVELLSPSFGEKKMQLLADADIFIFCPKKPEGHPWAIVEAMANGLPIISTDQGAIIESVKDKENGFIVPIESPEIIAEKLTLLLQDNSLRIRLGKESLRRYNSEFTESKMVDRLANVFNKVLLG